MSFLKNPAGFIRASHFLQFNSSSITLSKMALNITPINNHREREKGRLVYPVYSRRSGGLSVGINLFPDQKSCPFDCPYCEVFPFSSNAEFSPEQMESDLRAAVAAAQERGVPVRDICFSGNGEPSLSPAFGEALKAASLVRAELAPSAELVVITNGAGLLKPEIFSLLKDAANSLPLDIWLKLDAGTVGWYQKINRSNIPFENLIAKIKEFASLAPFTIQTMLCAIDGEKPPDDEARAWETLVCELAATAQGRIRKVQIYGKARPAPEDPLSSSLPASYLEERAASLRRAFTGKNIATPVEVYL
jgi:histidinol dehydrogenase